MVSLGYCYSTELARAIGVLDPVSLTWTSLEWSTRFGGPDCPPAPDYYPHMFMLSDGDLAYLSAYEISASSPTEWRCLRRLDTVLESWESYEVFRQHETNSACMYQKDKILTAGGTDYDTPEQFAEIIDFTTSPPTVTTLDALGYPMPTARHEMILLPIAPCGPGAVLPTGDRTSLTHMSIQRRRLEGRG